MTGGRARRVVLTILLAAVWLPIFRHAHAADPVRLTFLHFNDSYQISPQRGLGGFAELASMINAYRASEPNVLVTHGGDLISPSLLSSITRGRHMVELMNMLRPTAAVLGNHEFDHGLDVLTARIGESRFTWLAANVKTPEGQQFGGARAWMVREIGGLKVGFFGVITPESRKYIRGTTAVTFEDYIAAAARSVGALRKAGADIVVALTHMNMAEDRTLIRRVRGIHLVLGGHEHIPLTEMEGRTLILKAGSDAAYLGVVRLDVSRDSRGRVRVLPDWRLRPVRGVAPDPAVKAVVDRYNGQLDRELGLPIGVTRTPLDSRAEVVRSREASMGNLIADAMRAATKADIALMNGGGIRGNKTYPAGTQLTRKDILGEMPFNNRIVVLKITGKQLRAVLEYGLSRLGPGEGRFPQVSGLRLAYDAGRPPGDRITALTVGGKPVQPAASYSLATNDFLAGGGDGYVLLKGLPVLVNDQNGPALTESVIAYIRDHGVAAATVDGRIKAK